MKKLFFIIFCATFLFACQQETTPTDTTPTQEQETKKQETKTEKFYKIGDTISIADQEITIKSAEFTNERNEVGEKMMNITTPEKVLKISYTKRNNTEKDLNYGGDFRLYLNNREQTKYPNTGNTAGGLSAGREIEAEVFYAINGTGAIQLEYKPMLAPVGNKEKAIFKIEL